MFVTWSYQFLSLFAAAAAAAKSLQSCPTLCDPIDSSPPGSPVSGILQARTLEWAAISFSNAWKWKVKVKSLNRVRLLATPWTAAHQAPPSMGLFRQEYWSGYHRLLRYPSLLHIIFSHFKFIVLQQYCVMLCVLAYPFSTWRMLLLKTPIIPFPLPPTFI